MGNEYSRIKGRAFPTGSYILGFRQPDTLQVIHATPEMGKLVRQTVTTCWVPGIRSERKFSQGFELRLEKEPFDSEVQPIERLITIYKLVNQLLKVVLDAGSTLVTSGIFLHGTCRSCWILHLPQGGLTACHSAGDLLTVAFEDWGRLLTVNAPARVNLQLKAALNDAWPKGVQVVTDEPTSFAAELREQPWDSYKTDSDRSPLIVLALERILNKEGYEFLAATHARGNMDCLTFMKVENCEANQLDSEQQLMVLSLNQRDQIRLYNAPEDVARQAFAFCRKNWTPGVLRDDAISEGQRLQLKSSPWFAPEWDRSTAINARELLQELLKEICSLGWTVVLNADIYRSAYDKSLLILRRCQQTMVQPHLTVAIHEANHLLILGATEDLKEKLMTEVHDAWFRSQHCDAIESVSGWAIDFTFNDNPWQWDHEKSDITIDGLGLLTALLDFLRSLGWRLVANIDLTSSCKFAPTTWMLQLQTDEVRPLKIVG